MFHWSFWSCCVHKIGNQKLFQFWHENFPIFYYFSSPTVHLLYYRSLRSCMTILTAWLPTYNLHNRYDLVDMTRQALVLVGSTLYNSTMDAYHSLNYMEFMASSETFLAVLDDLESILRTNVRFMLGPWIESAKALGTTDDQKSLLEYNARIQVWPSSMNSQLKRSTEPMGFPSKKRKAVWLEMECNLFTKLVESDSTLKGQFH